MPSTTYNTVFHTKYEKWGDRNSKMRWIWAHGRSTVTPKQQQRCEIITDFSSEVSQKSVTMSSNAYAKLAQWKVSHSLCWGGIGSIFCPEITPKCCQGGKSPAFRGAIKLRKPFLVLIKNHAQLCSTSHHHAQPRPVPPSHTRSWKPAPHRQAAQVKRRNMQLSPYP